MNQSKNETKSVDCKAKPMTASKHNSDDLPPNLSIQKVIAK